MATTTPPDTVEVKKLLDTMSLGLKGATFASEPTDIPHLRLYEVAYSLTYTPSQNLTSLPDDFTVTRNRLGYITRASAEGADFVDYTLAAMHAAQRNPHHDLTCVFYDPAGITVFPATWFQGDAHEQLIGVSLPRIKEDRADVGEKLLRHIVITHIAINPNLVRACAAEIIRYAQAPEETHPISVLGDLADIMETKKPAVERALVVKDRGCRADMPLVRDTLLAEVETATTVEDLRGILEGKSYAEVRSYLVARHMFGFPQQTPNLYSSSAGDTLLKSHSLSDAADTESLFFIPKVVAAGRIDALAGTPMRDIAVVTVPEGVVYKRNQNNNRTPVTVDTIRADMAKMIHTILSTKWEVHQREQESKRTKRAAASSRVPGTPSAPSKKPRSNESNDVEPGEVTSAPVNAALLLKKAKK